MDNANVYLSSIERERPCVYNCVYVCVRERELPCANTDLYYPDTRDIWVCSVQDNRGEIEGSRL